MNKRGFTLLELIVVIIIIGVLATLGFVQYAKMVEKGRRAEAAANLGAIRSEAFVAQQESRVVNTANVVVADLGLPLDCNQHTHYFSYAITGDAIPYTATATRCPTTSGKQPGLPSGETNTMSLTIGGVDDGKRDSVPVGLW